jgi:hypothetical protein
MGAKTRLASAGSAALLCSSPPLWLTPGLQGSTVLDAKAIRSRVASSTLVS